MSSIGNSLASAAVWFSKGSSQRLASAFGSHVPAQDVFTRMDHLQSEKLKATLNKKLEGLDHKTTEKQADELFKGMVTQKLNQLSQQHRADNASMRRGLEKLVTKELIYPDWAAKNPEVREALTQEIRKSAVEKPSALTEAVFALVRNFQKELRLKVFRYSPEKTNLQNKKIKKQIKADRRRLLRYTRIALDVLKNAKEISPKAVQQALNNQARQNIWQGRVENLQALVSGGADPVFVGRELVNCKLKRIALPLNM